MDYLTEKRAEGFEGQRLYRLPAKALERIRSRPFTRDFIVTDLGYFPTAERHEVDRPDGVPQWILIFVNEGRGWVDASGQRHPLKSNEVLLIPPSLGHAYGADTAEGWSIFWFHFEGIGAEQILDWVISKQQLDIVPSRSPDGLRRQFRTIIEAVERGYHEHTLLELSRVLINVLTLLHRNPANESKHRNTERIEFAMDQMRTEIEKPRSLQDYAGKAKLSVSQFCHLFKQHTGVSPMHYQTEIRMQRACEYLDTTQTNIKDIAWQLGYEDPLYFSRAFKKCTGLSPSQYRKRM